jgi:hypothetical protein
MLFNWGSFNICLVYFSISQSLNLIKYAARLIWFAAAMPAGSTQQRPWGDTVVLWWFVLIASLWIKLYFLFTLCSFLGGTSEGIIQLLSSGRVIKKTHSKVTFYSPNPSSAPFFGFESAYLIFRLWRGWHYQTAQGWVNWPRKYATS